MSESTISLYNADCYEKIKDIPDNSIVVDVLVAIFKGLLCQEQ